jgi:hypothetical protein
MTKYAALLLGTGHTCWRSFRRRRSEEGAGDHPFDRLALAMRGRVVLKAMLPEL